MIMLTMRSYMNDLKIRKRIFIYIYIYQNVRLEYCVNIHDQAHTMFISKQCLCVCVCCLFVCFGFMGAHARANMFCHHITATSAIFYRLYNKIIILLFLFSIDFLFISTSIKKVQYKL